MEDGWRESGGEGSDTHSAELIVWTAGGSGGGGWAGAGGGATEAATAASGAAGGAVGGGTSTCFQSSPSSTIRAMRVPRGTPRLPSSIWNTDVGTRWDGSGDHWNNWCNLYYNTFRKTALLLASLSILLITSIS